VVLLTHPFVLDPGASPGSDPLPDALALWLGHPSVVVGCLALLGGYLLLVGPLRGRVEGSSPVPARRVASFAAGVAVMFVALSGPVHEYGDCCLFSVHMLQHLLLTMVMPPLLLLGLPAWAFGPLARAPLVGPLGRWAVRPVRAFLLFNVLFVASHLVPLYELQMRDHGFHIALHLAFMATAVVTWWPVAGPAGVPGWPRLSPPLATLYLFVQSLPGAVLGAIIGVAAGPLYPWYVEAPRVSGLSPLLDQQLGAIGMWVAGGFYWFGAMAVVYFTWAAREEKDEAEVRLSPGVSA
jgi:putative membrane protein